jgi:outer membrane protein
MIFYLKKILILIFIIFTVNKVHAETPHFIDFKFVLNESSAGKKAQNELKSLLDKGIQNIKKKEQNLQEEEKRIISQKKVLKPEEYKKKVSELRSNVSKLQKERKNLIDKTSGLRNKARNELLKDLNPIIKEYMVEKQIRMVIDKKSLLLADDKLDITKDIIKRLDQKIKSINLK